MRIIFQFFNFLHSSLVQEKNAGLSETGEEDFIQEHCSGREIELNSIETKHKRAFRCWGDLVEGFMGGLVNVIRHLCLLGADLRLLPSHRDGKRGILFFLLPFLKKILVGTLNLRSFNKILSVQYSIVNLNIQNI